MKTDVFSLKEKDRLFADAYSMHDCYFSAAYAHNTLTLTFDNLECYYGPPPATHWFQGYHKLTIQYHNTPFLNLTLKNYKKQKDFYDTLTPIQGKELIMYRYSVDSFHQMTLDFNVMIKKRLWGGKIEIAPEKIEYIWE